MNNEKLLRAMGEIDDRFIEEADVQAAVNTGIRRRRRNFAAIAASIAVVVIAGVLAINGRMNMPVISDDRSSKSLYENEISAQPASNTSAPAPSRDADPKDMTANTAYPPAVSDAASNTDYSVPTDTETLLPSKTSEMPDRNMASDGRTQDDISYTGHKGQNKTPQKYYNLGFPGLVWHMWLSGELPWQTR